MAEEKKHERHEAEHHEHHESKTVSIKKSTLTGIVIFVLLALLVVSIFTAGFGIVKPTGSAANTGNNQQATAPTIDTSAFTANSDLYPSVGPKNAKATVITVADFQCPYCALASGLPSWTAQTQYAQYADLIGAAGKAEQLAEQGSIRFIFVPWSFLDAATRGSGTTKESTWAAEAAYCAGDQGKYFEMHDAIYTASDGPSEDTGKYSIANLEILAKGVSGLDTSKFNSCLESETNLAKVQQVQSDVQRSGITGTPAFFVNGQSVQPSWTAIQAAINAA